MSYKDYMATLKPSKRTFDSGATRDVSDGKEEVYGFRHPLVEKSFMEYMNTHRKMADGSVRDGNNWWAGWPSDVSLQSLVRHVEDLQALHAGLVVLEIRNKDGVKKVYHSLASGEPYIVEKDDIVKVLNKEETLNAAKFNVNAYLLDLLR